MVVRKQSDLGQITKAPLILTSEFPKESVFIKLISSIDSIHLKRIGWNPIIQQIRFVWFTNKDDKKNQDLSSQPLAQKEVVNKYSFDEGERGMKKEWQSDFKRTNM